MEQPKPEDTESSVEMLDIEHLRDLVRMLRSEDVHSFQAGGLTVVFNEKPEYEPATKTVASTIADDGHSTSTKRVDGFKHEALWRHQNGKVLKFDGSLE